MSTILHVWPFLPVGRISIKDKCLNFDMKCQKICGNTGPYNLLTDRKYSSMKQFVLLSVVVSLDQQVKNLKTFFILFSSATQ